ncbi:MAG: hypothetical protein JXJ04_18810, partial [Spirochaetales bacterium]|nr:hypothetical protein [Spirochaetales bacterium]
MIPIIIISVLVAIAFVFFVFYIINIIMRKLKKKQIEKGIIIKTVLSGVLWAILGCINIVLIFIVIANGDPLLDSLINKGADVVSKTLVYTWQGVEQNWNKETLKK